MQLLAVQCSDAAYAFSLLEQILSLIWGEEEIILLNHPSFDVIENRNVS